MFVWVILNGISRLWLGRAPPAQRIYGCNYAYRDWPITDLVCIDRMTVASVRGDPRYPQGLRSYTRKSSLELPEGWQHHQFIGIDSGSAAVQLACEQTDQQILIIGADGVLSGDQRTAYTYAWHPRGPGRNIHLRHRRAMVELNQRHPNRFRFIWPRPDPDLRTCTGDIPGIEPGLINIPQGDNNGQTSDSQERHQGV